MRDTNVMAYDGNDWFYQTRVPFSPSLEYWQPTGEHAGDLGNDWNVDTPLAEPEELDARYHNNRDHPLFLAEPVDGKYTCPFAYKGCKHQPTPRKCNYDKYIDSHLKQYRCRERACKGLKMSSTACKLRHEREEHGKHGHGDRPFLCPHKSCQRSTNGFKRPFNLHDHIKRIHDNSPKPPKAKRLKRTESSDHVVMHEKWKQQYLRLHEMIHEIQSPYWNADILTQFGGVVTEWLSLTQELQAKYGHLANDT